MPNRALMHVGAVVVGGLPLSTGGGAQTVPQPERQALTSIGLTDAQARAELNDLSVTVRVQVEQRAAGGNTIRGVMETILLNSVSQLFAAQRVLGVDFIKGTVTFEGRGGQIRTTHSL